MFILNEEEVEFVIKVYKENRNTELKNMADISVIAALFDLNIHDPRFSKYSSYWDFVDAVLKNIETNRWGINPITWVNVLHIQENKELSESQINEKRYLCKRACNNLLNNNVNANMIDILLKWLTNDDGVDALLDTADIFVKAIDVWDNQ